MCLQTRDKNYTQSDQLKEMSDRLAVILDIIGTNSSDQNVEVQQFTIYIASTPGQYTVSYDRLRLLWCATISRRGVS